MKDSWIKEILNEKVISELSNPIMHSITGDERYNKNSDEIRYTDIVMENLKNINKNTKNLITVFESQINTIDNEIGDKINKINENLIELNELLKNK